MNSFSTFNSELRQVYKSHIEELISINDSTSSASNIQKIIRSLIPIERLKQDGSFFTPDVIAEKASRKFSNAINEHSVVFDPTCGSGNLLIYASKSLPVFRSLEDTIDLWSEILRGFDIEPEFVECTKLRLILEAVRRGGRSHADSLEDLSSKFRYIRIGDMYDQLESLSTATHLFINPPYLLQKAPDDCTWTSGRVNSAAIFMEHILNNMTSGAQFAAILPEVLRSGSSYSKWRSLVTSKCKMDTAIVGRFDSQTNVDVFVLSGEKVDCSHKINSSWIHKANGPVVGDKFNLAVGPLVAYRDKESGENAPYLFSKMLKPWTIVDEIGTTRRTQTKLFSPPFVAIKRTSSPSDLNRAAAALVLGAVPIAVENHLIVLRPKCGGVKICKQLIKILQRQETNKFLNQRIRCRHLTLDSIKEIPWDK